MNKLVAFMLASIMISGCTIIETYPAVYSKINGGCHLVKLEFDTFPGHSCFCRVQGIRDGESEIYIYIPIEQALCKFKNNKLKAD